MHTPMKFQLWFWGAFLLFFALPFPCILYFNTDYPVAFSNRSAPWLALLLLGASVSLWLGVLYAYLHYLLLAPPRALFRVRSILTDGEPREVRIEEAEQTGVHVRGFAQWKLKVALQNLSGTAITEQLVVVDSQPQRQRFVVGNMLPARLSRDPGVFPNMVLDGAQPEINTASLWRRGVAGAIGVALVFGAYVLAYRAQHEGMGWTFLSFGHPLLVCPLVLCGYVAVVRVLARMLHADARGEALKFRGIGVQATVLDVRQTGTYINEQPQVEFSLQYTDREGVVQHAKLRRIVALIDLAQLPRDNVKLLYDPDDRANVRMEDA